MPDEKFDYQQYLASREWAQRRRAVRERSGGVCERCLFVFDGKVAWSRPMYAVHHLTYEHIGNEPLEDLLAVCKECHDFLSAVTDEDPRATPLNAMGIAILVRLVRESGLSVDWILAEANEIHDRWKAAGHKIESIMQLVPPIVDAARREGLWPPGEDV